MGQDVKAEFFWRPVSGGGEGIHAGFEGTMGRVMFSMTRMAVGRTTKPVENGGAISGEIVEAISHRGT